MSVWNSSTSIQLLRFFAQHPSERFFVNELSRSLKLSKSAVSNSCKLLQQDHFLVRENQGPLAYYCLNKSNPIVKELNKVFLVDELQRARFVEKFLALDEGLFSLAVFGSRVKGDFSPASDLDVLVISNSKKIFSSIGLELGKKWGFEVSIKVQSFLEWKKLAATKAPFYGEVTQNNIVLHGNDIWIG